MGMTIDKAQKAMILDLYDMYDTSDISTERLLAMISDDTGCDIDEVVEVLKEQEDGNDD